MGDAGLFVATLIISLSVKFLLETLTTTHGGQVARVQKYVRRAADLLQCYTDGRVGRRRIVLRAHPCTKQVAQRRHEEVTMHAPPASHLPMVKAEFLFAFPENIFNRPPPECHTQQPPYGNAFARDGVDFTW